MTDDSVVGFCDECRFYSVSLGSVPVQGQQRKLRQCATCFYLGQIRLLQPEVQTVRHMADLNWLEDKIRDVYLELAHRIDTTDMENGLHGWSNRFVRPVPAPTRPTERVRSRSPRRDSES